MKISTIRFVIILATLSILGIIVTQMYWVQRAFDIKEKQFTQTIHIALKNVAEKIALLNKTPRPEFSPVNQVSSDYFIVNVNDAIDANVLEFYLKQEFAERHLYIDFEYGIYDCSSDKMMYGNYIVGSATPLLEKPDTELPKWNEFIYYFGIRFPNKDTYLASQMDIWIFSSAILLIVIVFFSYTMFVILKQKRLSEVQRDFINNMTHEFKTPISTIAVSADLITNPEIIVNQLQVETYANIIKKENNRLKNQIEKVLQMAKMDKGALALHKEEFDLHAFIMEATENFCLQNHLPKDALRYRFEAVKDHVMADKIHFTNVLYTLLDNAVKYVDQAPEISIKTQNKGNHLLLSIKDNGIGIPKEFQKRIFDKFFRVPTGNIHNIKGFGLGLSYVKLVVKAHRWKINLASEPDKGSEFEIVL